MRYLKHRRNLLLLSAVALLALGLCGTLWAIRYTVGTEVKVTQVRALREAEDEDTTDENIPKDVRRALKRKYGSRYDQYKLIAKETRLCNLGRDETFSLSEGKELIVRVVGYNPEKRLIDIRLQTSENIVAISIKSGTHIVNKLTDEDDPIITVVCPTLIQTER